MNQKETLPFSERIKLLIRNPTLLLFLLCVCIFLSYSNVIHGEFQFDDGYIVSDEGQFLKDPFKMLNSGLLNLLKSGTRLLPAWTFYFDYLIGGTSVEPFHITSILLHLFTVVVVYFFTKRILSEEKIRGSLPYPAHYIALAVAGLWGAHPLLTQAVSYISQRSEVMASFFYILAIMAFVRALETRHYRSFLYCLLGLVIFLAGWLSKVIVVTLPAAFFLYALYFKDRVQLKKAVLMVVPVLAIGAVFGLKMVLSFKETSNVGFKLKDIGQPEYFLTELRVLLTYLRLIFIPAGQSIDYDYPIYRSFFDINVLGSALFHFLLIGAALYTLKAKRTLYRVAGFGILWFYLLLLPTSSVVPIKDVIFEHRAYLASLGIVLAAVVVASKGLKSFKWATFLAVLLGVVLCFATFQRNFVWRTRLSLWLDAAEKAPNKSRVHNNLGICYYYRAEDNKAFYHFKRALELDPENLEAYYNMGLVLEAMGREAEAVYYYMMFMQKSKGRYPKFLKRIKEKYLSGKYGTP